MGKYYLCMEIGGTNLRYGIVTQDFQVLDFHKIASVGLSDASDKGAYIEELFSPLLRQYGKERICCIALSLASLMDKERSICYNSPNIRGFDKLPLKQILEKRMGLPVYMERDVNTALLYEIRKNKLETSGIMIGVFIGTGLGNAMCIDGKIYKGSTGSSCELGHIPVPGLEEMCGCGKKGCIELKACGKVLAKIAEDICHCPVEEVFLRHGEETAVKEVIKMCALAVAAEVTILDPSCVILGGGVTEMPGFPLDYFTETVKENLRLPNPREAFNLILASGAPEAGIAGAALNAAVLYRQP
ncbi:MAG: allose kinase [Lachnospiraceae bacterium]|nr:allose kinase [Lachnospiraceae bacterium]